jgi:WD40 repeat protein/serine/threonine protein kinase
MSDVKADAKAIFLQALECQAADELQRLLDEACRGDAALRARAEELLRAHQDAGNFLGGPQLLDATENEPLAERPGTVIGPYKLLEQIGEGGMGTVWMAEQTEPIQRRVAVKVVKEGMDSRQVLARFEAERQALALMEHPHIARVLDAGRTPSGRPYFVMELVKGQPITQYCDEKRLGVRERLELFGDVCRAVQHAHQKGVIHRDLKPSNVLVAPYDGQPVVKVIDFGVAKATGQRLTDQTLFTGFGALVGTPEYMSPEQAEVNNQDIDTRSDIYALGVLLYELLTGTTPLTRKRVQEAALLEVLRVIREEEPPRPSTRLSESKASLPSISAQRQTEPAKLTRLVRGELDWIVMKALEKDRNRRYDTANGFAQDIERYLADEPVQACPPSAGYRLRKFVRRHRGPLLAATVIFLLLIGGIVGTSLGLLQARTSEKRAEGAAIKAGEERDAANEARTAALEAGEAEKVQRQRAEDLGKELRRSLYFAQMNMAGEAVATPLGLGRVAELLAPWREGQPDLRGWEWYYLYGQCHQDLLTIPVASKPVWSVAWSPDGTRLATTQGPSGYPVIWDAATGKEAVVLEWGDIPTNINCRRSIAWSPDGTQVACAYLGWLAICDAATGKRRHIIHLSGQDMRWSVVACVAWSPDGRRLASAGDYKDIRILDAKTGKPDRILKGHTDPVTSMAWSHDGTRLAAGDQKGKLRIWDVAAGKVVLDINAQGPVLSISWNPDDRRLFPANGSSLDVWDTTTGKQLVLSTPYPFCSIFSGAWSPDGKRLALGTGQGEVRINDAATGRSLSILRGHGGSVWCVAWSPDGTRLASASYDGTVKVWDPNQPDEFLGRAPRAEFAQSKSRGLCAVSWSPNGKRLVSAGAEHGPGFVQVWNVAARGGAAALDDPVTLTDHARGTFPTVASWSPDGTRIASTDAEAIQIWDAATGKELRTLKGHVLVRSLAWSPNGKRLASAEGDGTVILWDPATREQTRRLKLDERSSDPVNSVAWSPDGTRLAAACISGVVVIWDTTTGQSTCSFKGEGEVMTSVAWHPGGAYVASAGRNSGVIQIWDASTGKVLCTLKGHTPSLFQVSWSPDGKRLASCSGDETAKIWDPITGEVVITFSFKPKNNDYPACLDWSRDGSCLAVGCSSGAIEILDAAKGYQLAGAPGAGRPE